MCTCILQITAWVSYNKIQRLHSYHIGRTMTYRHHMRIRFISISPRWKHVCMSSKSKTIFSAGLPNVPVEKHACMRSMLVGRTRKYQSWGLLIPSGRRWMSRFGMKGLPLSYVFGQSFDHLMASTFGYCFAIWWSLLVTASSKPRDGTFFNLVLRLELVMRKPLGHRWDVFH